MKKLLGSAIALSVVFSTSLLSPVFAAGVLDPNTLPDLNRAENGKVGIGDNHDMNVQVQGGQGSVGQFWWNNFNVGSNASVNFEFSAHNQTALNKVEQTGGMSQIFGQITNSGCATCGYEGTGKVILINPNGVLFGDGANVNLNSFTVSTFNGDYDSNSGALKLQRQENAGDINVMGNARIHGEEGVNFAATNINLYNGSKISTGLANNFNNNTSAMGKVKLVTGDGVTFNYYNSGSVKDADVKTSKDKMVIQVNGEIEAGNIDIRNYSSNEGSQINLKNANLKAVKAVKGNDGSIWLTAANDIVIGESNITTSNAEGAENPTGGDVLIQAGRKVTLRSSEDGEVKTIVNAVGNVDLISTKSDVLLNDSIVNAAGKVNVTAANVAALENGAKIKSGADITLNGKNRTQIIDGSDVTAENGNILILSDKLVWAANGAKVTANNGNVNVESQSGDIQLSDTTLSADNNDVTLKSAGSITSEKLKGSILAGRNVGLESTQKDVILSSVSQFETPQDGAFNLKAANNVEINSEADLNLNDKNYNFEAGNNIFLTSQGDVNIDRHSGFISAENIYVTSGNNLNIDTDLNNIQTNLSAGNDLTATLSNAGTREKGLIATAVNDMTINSDGTLYLSKLVSGNNMTLNADKIAAAAPFTEEYLKEEGDSTGRAYIEAGGIFETSADYTITDSAEKVQTNGKIYGDRHHLYFEGENGENENFLLVNKKQIGTSPSTEIPEPEIPEIPSTEDKEVVDPDNLGGDVDPSIPGGGEVKPPVDPDKECEKEPENQEINPEEHPQLPEVDYGDYGDGGDSRVEDGDLDLSSISNTVSSYIFEQEVKKH